MPTSGDLKSDPLIFTTPPPPFPEFQLTPFPPTNWPSRQWEWLRTLLCQYCVNCTRSKFLIIVQMPKLYCQWLNACKNASETVLRIKKIQILREKWAKSQTISKEKCKGCLVREICWPVPEKGRSVSYPESWYMCRTLEVIHTPYQFLARMTARDWERSTKSETQVLGSTISLICDMASTWRMHTAILSGQCLYIWREKLWVDTGVNIAQSQRNLSLIVWITVDFLFTGLWVSLRLKCDEMNIRQLATFNMHNYERLHDFRDLHNLPDTVHKSGQTTILLTHAACHIFITKSKRDKQHLSCVFLARSPVAFFPKGYVRINKGNKKGCKHFDMETFYSAWFFTLISFSIFEFIFFLILDDLRWIGNPPSCRYM